MGKRGPVAKYVVRLSSDERDRLEGLIRTGREAAYRIFDGVADGMFPAARRPRLLVSAAP